jgi:AraC-like DNA-binding protein/quercetin dioxygenase-like cupin family protein
MKTKSIEKRTTIEKRDPVKDIVDTPRPVVALSKDFPDGHTIPFHKHWRAQLLYASSGVMTVTTSTGIWVVPPLRGVWIPENTNHQIYCSGRLLMRTLYFDPSLVAEMEQTCMVVSIPPLLRELILEFANLPQLYTLGGKHERLVGVLLDQVNVLKVDPLDLPLPRDSRLQHIVDYLKENPADNRSVDEWSKQSGMTSRTLSRLFRRETGMSFRQWKQQIRILEALRQLGQNEAVTTVSLNMGYDSPSAFIAMFKKALGTTPGKYFGIKSES